MPNLIERAGRSLRSMFSYDATIPSNNRRTAKNLLRTEDRELTTDQRGKLITTARDLARNFAIARWMIARHLDYVTSFAFQSKTGNDQLDSQVERFITTFSKRRNCDAAGRHRLSKLIRIAEARRITDGDIGLLKLCNGTLQAVEGDRIRNPVGTVGDYAPQWYGNVDGAPPAEWVEGVRLNPCGGAVEYSIWRRGPGANLFVPERTVPACNLYLHAHYSRLDQVRGISPIASALNTLRDTADGVEFALAKMKISQLFGIHFGRKDSAVLGDISEDIDETEDSDADTSSKYKIDFGRGPWMLDLDDGDEAKIIESQTPSTEFQQFIQTTIAIALKSLNIPYSFYDEGHTNYSGSRLAYLQYDAAAETDRDDVRELLDYVTEWRIALAIQDGDLPANYPVADRPWQWISRGMPWLDPLKEVMGDLVAIDSGLDNPEDVAQRHGKNVYENIDKTARVRAYAASKGVTLNTVNIVTAPPDSTPTGATNGINANNQ